MTTTLAEIIILILRKYIKLTLTPIANNSESANNANSIAAAAGGLVILDIFAASYIYKKFFVNPISAQARLENSNSQQNKLANDQPCKKFKKR